MRCIHVIKWQPLLISCDWSLEYFCPVYGRLFKLNEKHLCFSEHWSQFWVVIKCVYRTAFLNWTICDFFFLMLLRRGGFSFQCIHYKDSQSKNRLPEFSSTFVYVSQALSFSWGLFADINSTMAPSPSKPAPLAWCFYTCTNVAFNEHGQLFCSLSFLLVSLLSVEDDTFQV